MSSPQYLSLLSLSGGFLLFGADHLLLTQSTQSSLLCRLLLRQRLLRRLKAQQALLFGEGLLLCTQSS